MKTNGEARKENFAVYMLSGWRRFITSKHIKPHMSVRGQQRLLAAIDMAILDVKDRQIKRKMQALRVGA